MQPPQEPKPMRFGIIGTTTIRNNSYSPLAILFADGNRLRWRAPIQLCGHSRRRLLA